MAYGPRSAGIVTDRPTIDSVREITDADLAGLEREQELGRVQQFRDSHHMVARLFAMGLRPGQVAEETGYSAQRVWTLFQDPAFQELVAHYRGIVDDQFAESQDEYYRTVSANRRISARLINDKLNDTEPDDIGFRELVLIHSDAADRTGYPKRNVAVNVNMDFASLLDKAVARSDSAKVISTELSPPASPPGGAEPGGRANQPSQPSDPLRRRA